MFDPYMDGRGAVKAGCTRCEALAEIHDCHQKMIRLMRGFAPPPMLKRPDATLDSTLDDRQESLFD